VSRLASLSRRPVWIQAVSVGEVILARTLLESLQDFFSNAGDRTDRAPHVVLSSTTPAGRDAAAAIQSPLLEGVFHFPIDWAPIVRRLLGRVNPSLFIAIETEIWPGLLRQCAQRQVPAIIVNGRISHRSHGRYRRFRGMLREPLGAVRLACMQTADDAERARSIGIPADRIVVTGNMKFDAAPPRDGANGSGSALPALPIPDGARVLVAGSTSEGEEEIVLDAFDRLAPRRAEGTVLILAPRHRERFDAVARLLERRRLRFVRRSSATIGAAYDVLLLDSIGELADVYSRGQAAFVGGSLVPRGGQNLIEPAARGVPVLFGPHTENFAAVAQALLEAGAGFRVSGADDLASTWSLLLADTDRRQRAGNAARALIEAHRGATARTIRHILPFIG
jgi:3-deoxy-D-manno-octulosonic-acid transferase